MNILQWEEYDKLGAGRQWGEIRPGDSINIQKLPFASATKAETIKGMVIGITKKRSDTAIKMLNVSADF